MSAVLLVTDARALDLERVRAVAAGRGWDVELQRLDGAPPGEPPSGWFPEALRLVVTGRPGSPAPDAALLVTASPGLALDTTHRRPDV
jgi:hypothetical protein